MLEQQFIGEYILRKSIYGQFALLFGMTTAAAPHPPDDRWRAGHLGRLLGQALRRFDERVLYLMAHDANVPLSLSNLAARAQVGAAHIHITRHLALKGSRLTELAASAGMSKQAMGDLVTQWHYLLAMTVITLLPITLVFAFLQKYIAQGIASAGVK